MKFNEVATAMRDQPWGVTEDQGRQLYEFVLRERPDQILELGAGIGTSAAYMTAAMEEIGAGKLTSIDRTPDLHEWVAKTFAKCSAGMRKHHELTVTATSYNDELMWLIERQSATGQCIPLYDFCFIDGAHTWEVDACAFFLAEKLLKPCKWILFDDLTWTMAGSAEQQKNMKSPVPVRLQETQQVMNVFTLCVAQHPRFTDIRIEGDWGWARKSQNEVAAKSPIKIVTPSVPQRVVNKIRRLVS